MVLMLQLGLLMLSTDNNIAAVDAAAVAHDTPSVVLTCLLTNYSFCATFDSNV